MYPIFFSFGPIEIHYASIFLTLGFVMSIIILLKSIQLRRLKIGFILENYLLFLLVGIVGARIGYLVNNWTLFSFVHPQSPLLGVFMIWDKGMSLWGGMLSILIIFILVTLLKKENTLKWLDAATIPLLCILFFNHLGNFFEGNEYGRETSLPWGMIFNSNKVKYTVPIHPTQLYFVIGVGIIFLVIRKIKPKIMKEPLKNVVSSRDLHPSSEKRELATKTYREEIRQGAMSALQPKGANCSRKYVFQRFLNWKKDGNTFMGATILYASLTFLIGFLRGDDTHTLLFLRLDQIIALLTLIILIVFIKRKKTELHQKN